MMCTNSRLLALCSAFVVVTTVATSAAALSPQDVSTRLEAAHRALDDWQLEEAAQAAAELDAALPDIPAVQELVGTVRFHQGDYAAAVSLLKRAAEGGANPPLLALAESTLKETQGNKTFRSEHFELRLPPGKDEVLVEPALWALEKAFKEISDAFDYTPSHRIVVDILHDARGLASVSTLTVKEIETSGTIALCKYNRLMVTSPKALARGYGWLDTLAHELVHLVVSEKSRNTVPIWLHEGLAKYSESLWRGAPGLALHPAAEKLLADAVKANKLITFKEMHPSMAKLPSQEATALAFAEVFTMVEFLQRPGTVTTKKGRKARVSGFKVTNELIDSLSTGAKMDAALKTSVGGKLARVEKRWRRYLKKRKFKLVPGAKPQELTFVRDARSGAAQMEDANDEAALDEAKGREARRYVRLGNLLRRKGRNRAAIVEYEKAVAKIPGRSPMLQNRLAGLYLDQDQTDRAEELLRQSLVAFPDDPHTHILLGRTALREKHWADAKKHYLRATWENPFIPEIYAALVQVGEKMADSALADRGRSGLELLRGHKRDDVLVTEAPPDAPAGTLTVTSSPWGEIYLNGAETFASTPFPDWRLSPGTYRIRVRDPATGHQATETVEVKEGESQRVALRLKAVDATTLESWQQKERAMQAAAKERARTDEDREAEKADAASEAFSAALLALEEGRDDDALAAVVALREQLEKDQDGTLTERQRAWFAFIEVRAYASKGAANQAASLLPDDDVLRELPAAAHIELLETAIALATRRSRPDLVLPLSQRCDKRARQSRQQNLVASCAQTAGAALVSIGEPGLVEIVATRLLDAGKELGHSGHILEGVDLLMKNFAVTRSPIVKGRLRNEIATVKGLVEAGAPGAEVALANMEALVSP